MPVEQRFIVDGLTPETLPMERLAEYLSDLAKLVGCREAVHFRAIEAGSAVLVWQVDESAVAAITARLAAVGAGAAPDEAMRAYRMLNRKLAADKATARLDQDGATVIRFPGSTVEVVGTFGPFAQRGSLEGMVVRIGGLDETAHVTLEDGATVWARCETNRELASDLARFLYQGRVRVHGVGRWHRDEQGAWHLDRFKIENFEPLEGASIRETVERLRAIPGNEWAKLPDPWRVLRELRGGDDAA
jgi:hypothetical protein